MHMDDDDAAFMFAILGFGIAFAALKFLGGL